MLLNGHPGGFVSFLRRPARKGSITFHGGCDLHGNFGMAAILLCFLCNYDNLKLRQGKHCYPAEGWLFIGILKAGSVLGMSVAFKASKKIIKIHYEYDAKPLTKSYKRLHIGLKVA